MSILLCKKYLHALNSGKIEDVLKLFDEGAVVVSPLYGEMLATDFYRKLFEDTSNSETRFIGVFEPAEPSRNILMHFKYKWTFKNNHIVEFECVDIFQLTEANDRFQKLIIVYDTYPIRKDFEENKNS